MATSRNQPAPPVPPVRLAKFQPAEVIVASQHEPKLVRVLRDDLRIDCTTVETDPLLGLARIVVDDVDGAARALPDRLTALASPAAQQWQARYPRPDRTAQPLDQVLWAVRGHFAARYSGWTPSIGKNRFVGQVHGVGEVNHGGGGRPFPAKKGITLADRLSGPGRGARVGVLDTAFYPQPWLAGGWSARFTDRILEPGHRYPFAQGHATFVTGLVLGMAPGANVEVRSVLDEVGEADSWTVAKAIVEFGRSGLDVLNLSFTCYTEDGDPPMVLAAAIDRLDPRIVVVAAAGNHGAAAEAEELTDADATQPAWPAAFDDVIAVGATDLRGARMPFSPDAPWVDVLAPGNRLLSTYLPLAGDDPGEPFDDYAIWSGTSFAAALVSGAIAAGVDPGRVSAREAVGNIEQWLREHQDRVGVPPHFLPLTPPFGGDLELPGRRRTR